MSQRRREAAGREREKGLAGEGGSCGVGVEACCWWAGVRDFSLPTSHLGSSYGAFRPDLGQT